jgi:hypothetical protein
MDAANLSRNFAENVAQVQIRYDAIGQVEQAPCNLTQHLQLIALKLPTIHLFIGGGGGS